MRDFIPVITDGDNLLNKCKKMLIFLINNEFCVIIMCGEIYENY